MTNAIHDLIEHATHLAAPDEYKMIRAVLDDRDEAQAALTDEREVHEVAMQFATHRTEAAEAERDDLIRDVQALGRDESKALYERGAANAKLALIAQAVRSPRPSGERIAMIAATLNDDKEADR